MPVSGYFCLKFYAFCELSAVLFMVRYEQIDGRVVGLAIKRRHRAWANMC